MNQDIQPLLNEWPFEPGQLCVRIIKGENGREKIQLRIEMGILQMEVTGRPDGQRPHGSESLLHYYQTRSRKAEERREKFFLDSEMCMDLQLEALQYYHRRISFLEIGDYLRAKQDAERNLMLFDFVKDHAEDEEDRVAFEHYRPFVIGHRVRAEVLMQLEREAYDSALEKIDAGIAELQTLFQIPDRPEFLDENEEIAFLREWAEEIRKDRPRTPTQNLRDKLRDAVAREDFERAAKLRDQLLSIEGETDT